LIEQLIGLLNLCNPPYHGENNQKKKEDPCRCMPNHAIVPRQFGVLLLVKLFGNLAFLPDNGQTSTKGIWCKL